jgi:hypothetical protein
LSIPIHVGDNVADRDVRKIRTIGSAGLRVDAAGIGRTEGRAKHVRGDDEQLVRIDRLARPDQAVPRAGLVPFAGLRPAKWWLAV